MKKLSKTQRWLLRFIYDEPGGRIGTWDFLSGTKDATIKALVVAGYITADVATEVDGPGKYVVGFVITDSGRELAATLPYKYSKEWR